MPGPLSFEPIDLQAANALLDGWGHYLGPCRRPFGTQAWALLLDDVPVSVAISASTVSATCEGMPRRSLVELARLCSDPAQRWATRPMLRLWREVGAPRWPYWQVTAAVAYSQNARHPGDLYRFDGWTRGKGGRPSGGGGQWSTRLAGQPARGAKTVWVWRYAADDGG